MSQNEIVERLREIIAEQSIYHAFSRYTKPKLEKLIGDIENESK